MIKRIGMIIVTGSAISPPAARRQHPAHVLLAFPGVK